MPRRARRWGAAELALAVAVAAVVFVALELEKWMKRRRGGRTAPRLEGG